MYINTHMHCDEASKNMYGLNDQALFMRILIVTVTQQVERYLNNNN